MRLKFSGRNQFQPGLKAGILRPEFSQAGRNSPRPKSAQAEIPPGRNSQAQAEICSGRNPQPQSPGCNSPRSIFPRAENLRLQFSRPECSWLSAHYLVKCEARYEANLFPTTASLEACRSLGCRLGSSGRNSPRQAEICSGRNSLTEAEISSGQHSQPGSPGRGVPGPGS